MSRDGPEAGSLGVTAGVPPEGHTEVGVASPSELLPTSHTRPRLAVSDT